MKKVVVVDFPSDIKIENKTSLLKRENVECKLAINKYTQFYSLTL